MAIEIDLITYGMQNSTPEEIAEGIVVAVTKALAFMPRQQYVETVEELISRCKSAQDAARKDIDSES